MRLLDGIAANARRQLETFAEGDDVIRRLWEVIDLVLAIMRGVIRFGLATDPRGLASRDRSGHIPLLERVMQLYYDGRIKHYLQTFRQLDHFGPRDGEFASVAAAGRASRRAQR